jgi:uncharacterized protein involved in high-affinity Fe2+ transport
MRKMLMVTALVALVLCAGTATAVEKPKATAGIVDKGSCIVRTSYVQGVALTSKGQHILKLKVTNTHFEKAIEKIKVRFEVRAKGKRVPVATVDVALNLSGGIEPRKSQTEVWPIAEWTLYHRSDQVHGEAGLIPILDMENGKSVLEELDDPNGYAKFKFAYDPKYTWKVKVLAVQWYEDED